MCAAKAAGAQGGHEQCEKRHRLLILEGLTEQGAYPGLVGQRHHLGQQPALPDARRALDDQDAPVPCASAVTNAPITFNSPARPRIGGVASRWPLRSNRPVESPTECPVSRYGTAAAVTAAEVLCGRPPLTAGRSVPKTSTESSTPPTWLARSRALVGQTNRISSQTTTVAERPVVVGVRRARWCRRRVGCGARGVRRGRPPGR
jgi:hypothetical protein